MKSMSVQEMEELGKVIGTALREQYPHVKDEATIKSLILSTVRGVLRESATRKAQWGFEPDPKDVFNIEKRLYEPAGNDDVSIQLQKWNDDVYILMKATNVDTPFALKSYSAFSTRWGELAKALATSNAGQGEEWIPTGFSNQLIEMVEIEAVVANLFESFRMPTNPYTFPLLLSDGEAYLGAEATSDSPDDYKASTPTTSNLTFTAKKLISRAVVSEEMDEDSVIAVMPMLKSSIARSHAKAEDNAILNGDISTTHFDTGYSVATEDARRAWEGLRHECQSTLKQSGSTWATTTGLALIRGIREDMGVYGLKSADVNVLVNANMYSKLKSVTEVTTVDKIGNVATIINGEIAKFDGMQITTTQHVGENMNASGIYDAVTTSTTQLLLVYKPGFKRGIRRDFTLEVERRASKGVSYLVATSRRIWKPIFTTSTQAMIGWLYNITK